MPTKCLARRTGADHKEAQGLGGKAYQSRILISAYDASTKAEHEKLPSAPISTFCHLATVSGKSNDIVVTVNILRAGREIALSESRSSSSGRALVASAERELQRWVQAVHIEKAVE